MSVSILTVSQGSRRRFLDQLVRCVEKQTYSNITEWIIVDGSKTNEDSTILQTYFGKLQNFRCTIIVSSWLGSGCQLGELRNIANRAAKGYYIAWMDDDDYYNSGYIEYAVSQLHESPNCVAGCAIPYMYDVYYKTIHQFDLIDDKITMNSCMVYKKEFLLNNAYATNAVSHEEIHFLRNFSENMIQLDPKKTMLLINHSDNIIKRSYLIHSSHAGFPKGVTLTSLKLADLVNDADAIEFYQSRVCEPQQKCPYDIVYFCGAFSLPWTPHDTSLGGSEQAVVQLSEEWTRMGKKVCVYGDLTLTSCTLSGVDYFHYNLFNPNQRFKTLIVWRFMGLALLFTPKLHWYTADRIIVDLHDNLPQAYTIVAHNLDKIDKIIFKSRYHVREFEAKTGTTLPWNKTAVILNGIQTSIFGAASGSTVRDQYRFCYTSSYTRGLLEILELWKDIVELEPRAELHLYYGTPINPGDAFYEAYAAALVSSKNVCDHDRVPIHIVAEEKRHATFHMYPTNTIGEIDCIAIRESLVAGCIPILSYNKVFKERDGYFVKGDMSDPSNYPQIAQEIVALARDRSQCDRLRDTLSRSRTICTWKDTAREWLRELE